MRLRVLKPLLPSSYHLRILRLLHPASFCRFLFSPSSIYRHWSSSTYCTQALCPNRPGSSQPLVIGFFSTGIVMKALTSKVLAEGNQRLPDCWGHRGASAVYPENTLASFERAIRDGSEGIESDVHISLDNVVIMFHDPSLDRTTNMTGMIHEKKWYGPDGMEHARTKKQPTQSIPTFVESVELLMKKENRHVVFDVDCKVYNEPIRLFTLMHEIISSHENWETDLAPRIVLGLWHPKFIEPAKKILPYCRRSHIGKSPYIARKFFWEGCDAFSISFGALQTFEGEKFRKECKAAAKKLMVWTVNDQRQMMECIRWEVDAVITDVTKNFLEFRASVEADYAKAYAENGRLFMWTRLNYYLPMQILDWKLTQSYLETAGGPFSSYEAPSGAAPIPATVSA